MAGAKSFGLPAFWVNRQRQPTEELGMPGAAGSTLNDLLGYLSKRFGLRVATRPILVTYLPGHLRVI
jgi:hypothetical protein